jgi:hypothetical protein
MPKSIIIVGNLFDGIYHVGPFDDHEDAIEWADANCKGEWLVATLEAPEPEAKED